MKRTAAPIPYGAGLLAPRKYDEIRFTYSDTENASLVVNMKYYNNSIFISRVETTFDSQGRELTIIAYNTDA